MPAFADAVSRVAFDVNGEITSLESRRIADAILAMPEMTWLRQFLVDTLNTDFLSAYQCELVGEVPDVLLRWADIDDDWAEQ